ncbi:FHF complex subunit HOOK-interacting protein 2B [Conger conger]|uniref:FHF complex subunit HOOK-interacting protein 2B n=1 Tax=Conger conger TaxID=82655 RepID=UPI002A5ACBDD|nr:FHF complex subunit HOOK-interacting protein 2B [Conger conger]
MDMFSKLTNLFQQALETREPSINLLESFVDHWKGITNYYIETTDETTPAKQTDIPWRLKQMLDILVYEEEQQETEETGPCMEYLLQHKLLETLCTLGKAQYPPGMSQQVLAFFSKLLIQVQQPMLHIINVYRPVQKLIRLCALPGSQTEKEEAQFLFVICSRLKQDPYVLNYILEIKRDEPIKKSRSTSGDGVGIQSAESPSPEKEPSSPLRGCTAPDTLQCEQPGPSSAPEQPQNLACPSSNNLIHALIHLTKSQKSRVALKAQEGLSVLVNIPKEETALCLAESTSLCQLLAGRLCELYSLVPSSLDPMDLYGFPQVHWRDRFSQGCLEKTLTFPGSEDIVAFLGWLDFCDNLAEEAQKVLSVKLAEAIHHQWLTAVVQPQLLQISEAGILLSTALLSCAVRHIAAPALLDQLVLFLLGRQSESELRSGTDSHTLRHQLIERCDHISDEISMSTLRLFEELLQKPHEHIAFNLVLRNLEQRGYMAAVPGGAEDRHTADPEPPEESEALEEDPFFTDMYPEEEFHSSGQLLSLPPRQVEPRATGQERVADVVNSFLCLVPQEAKTSQHVQGAGYDTYVHDAHELFKECTAFSLQWGWPASLKPPEPLPAGLDFYEGHFLKVLFDRLAGILEQPYELNLQVTSVLSRLAVLPHPHLHEYLLDPYISLAPGSRSLFSVLIRVIGDLMQRIQHIPNFTERLVHVRKQLMALEPEMVTDHMTLLKGVIVLEEFCKELAAIAFVKLPLEEH